MSMQDQEGILRICIDVDSVLLTSVRATNSDNCAALVLGRRGSDLRMPNSVTTANPACLTQFLTKELPSVYNSRSGFFKGQSVKSVQAA
jgi:hypothetical protein